MESDHSRELFERYFALDKRLVNITLRNGSQVRGIIIAFSKGDEYLEEPFITHWHLVDEKDKMSLGTNMLGLQIGQLIAQEDIVTIQFYQDNSIMNFDI